MRCERQRGAALLWGPGSCPGVGAAAGGHQAQPGQGVLGVPPPPQQLRAPVNKPMPGLHPNASEAQLPGAGIGGTGTPPGGAELAAQPHVVPIPPRGQMPAVLQ